MSDKRMAGDKLDEPTKASSDAKQALSQSERNKQIREEIGNDPERLAERISIVDRDKYDFDGYTDKEINMALQGGTFDDNDYARLTGDLGDGGGGGDDNKPTDPPDVGTPEDPISPMPEIPGQPDGPGLPGFPSFPGGGGAGAGQNQQVMQDNDINTAIQGDGNTTDINQDNSVRQSGGSRYLADWMKSHNFFN